MVGIKNSHIRKNLTQKVVNPRDIAGERKKNNKKKNGHIVSQCAAEMFTLAFQNKDFLIWRFSKCGILP